MTRLAVSRNLDAFLDMLAWSEIGPRLLAESDDGYNVLVGATTARPLLFNSYADHPNVYNRRLDSTAAGRYQILHRYWPHYRAMLRLPDFGPESQDKYAIQQIREQGALDLVECGDVDRAVAKVANIWASLPGAGYDQHEHDMRDLRDAFTRAGGFLQCGVST